MQLRSSRMVASRLRTANADLVREGRERQAAEDAVTTILESAPDAILVVDRRGRILQVNARTEAMFGYTRPELLALSLEALVPESDRTRHPAMRAAYFATPDIRAMNGGRPTLGRRRDGAVFPIEASLSPVVDAGKPASSRRCAT